MPDCRKLEPLFTPYVDGELATGERDTVDAHVRQCPPCRARVEAEGAVRTLLRSRRAALGVASAPAALRARCAAAPAAAAGRGSLAAWRARLGPLALAASLVLVVGGAFVYELTDRSTRVMAAELTADHMKCFALNNVLGTHQSATAVEGAMLSGFGWRLRVPADTGLQLVGARPCLYGEGRVAHVMFRHDGRPVSLFMLPGSTRPEEVLNVLGHEAAIWSSDQRTYVLIAEEPRAEVQQMAAVIQAGLP
ncbi:MAG: anti-sigma factor family protein [Betaproteobacteria bacterium]